MLWHHAFCSILLGIFSGTYRIFLCINCCFILKFLAVHLIQRYNPYMIFKRKWAGTACHVLWLRCDERALDSKSGLLELCLWSLTCKKRISFNLQKCKEWHVLLYVTLLEERQTRMRAPISACYKQVRHMCHCFFKKQLLSGGFYLLSRWYGIQATLILKQGSSEYHLSTHCSHMFC